VCTVMALRAADGGFVLAANRDELASRSPAHPPRLMSRAGLKLVYPLDPDGGGSWISANSAGVAMMLLNNFEAEVGVPSAPEPVSRGLVVKALASCCSLTELQDACSGSAPPSLSRVAPFVLIAIESAPAPSSSPAALRLAWDGQQLDVAPWRVPGVESSSGSMGEEARSARESALAGQGLLGAHPVALPSDAQIRDAFAWHHPAADSRSVCVHGDFGGSRSHTVVRVTAEQVRMSYFVGPPCGASRPLVVEFSRDPRPSSAANNAV